jgi:NAD(P)-dependent dehydrogenase (short-subunit alcohol dehydrogenase family)
MQATKKYTPFKCYAQSKLANVMTAAEIHHRSSVAIGQGAPGSRHNPVCATSVHPGLVDTPLARHYFENDWPFRWLRPVVRPLVRLLEPAVLLKPAVSAHSVAYAALADSAAVAGQYVVGQRVARPAKAAQDEVQRARLWSKSCKLAGIADPLPMHV